MSRKNTTPFRRGVFLLAARVVTTDLNDYDSITAEDNYLLFQKNEGRAHAVGEPFPGSPTKRITTKRVTTKRITTKKGAPS